MEKDLTPLEALEKLTNYKCSRMSEKIECKEIIKSALEDYENLKLKHKSMQDAVLDDFKKLKALEIIKKYFRIDGLIEFLPKETQNRFKEDFDLIKEVLYE